MFIELPPGLSNAGRVGAWTRGLMFIELPPGLSNAGRSVTGASTGGLMFIELPPGLSKPLGAPDGAWTRGLMFIELPPGLSNAGRSVGTGSGDVSSPVAVATMATAEPATNTAPTRAIQRPGRRTGGADGPASAGSVQTGCGRTSGAVVGV
jgi:hypothetical protein